MSQRVVAALSAPIAVCSAAVPIFLRSQNSPLMWLRNHLPYPFWASCNRWWWSPWCWIDDICHLLFPMTFGFSRTLNNGLEISHWPDPELWCCRIHERSTTRYAAKKWPDDE